MKDFCPQPYRAGLTLDGLSHGFDGLATLELGTRAGNGFDRDPNGLILKETVFHDLAGLASAGLLGTGATA
jgi:hypothetical protein